MVEQVGSSDEVGRILGVPGNTIRAWKVRGLIGGYGLAEVAAYYAQVMRDRVAALEKRAESDDWDELKLELLQHRVRKEKALADQAEIDAESKRTRLEVEQGKLFVADEVMVYVQNFVIRSRQLWEGVPQRFALPVVQGFFEVIDLRLGDNEGWQAIRGQVSGVYQRELVQVVEGALDQEVRALLEDWVVEKVIGGDTNS